MNADPVSIIHYRTTETVSRIRQRDDGGSPEFITRVEDLDSRIHAAEPSLRASGFGVVVEGLCISLSELVAMTEHQLEANAALVRALADQVELALQQVAVIDALADDNQRIRGLVEGANRLLDQVQKDQKRLGGDGGQLPPPS